MRVEEEKFRLPVDVSGSKTSVLKLSIISVADHFAPSCCFVQLFSRLIASRRIVLSLNFCRRLGNCFVVV